MDNFAGLGSRIMECRQNKDMTRENLAEKLDVSVNFVYEMETGKKIPSLKNFYNLCKILNARADYLLFGDDPERRKEDMKSKILETLSDCTEDELRFISDVSIAYKKAKGDLETK